MKIYSDPNKQLNLHPLSVYFLLSADGMRLYADRLTSLNRKRDNVCALFKFEVMERVSLNHEALTPELLTHLEQNNVVVRLFDAYANCYRYAFEHLSLDSSVWDTEVQQFLNAVCSENLQTFQHERSRLQGEDSNELLSELDKAIRSLKEIVESSNDCRESSVEEEDDEAQVFYSRSPFEALFPLRQYPNRSNAAKIERIIKTKYASKAHVNLKEVSKEILYLMDFYYEAPTGKYSNEMMQGAMDKTKGKALKEDQAIRKCPASLPDIRVEVKKIVAKRRNNGSKQTKWVIEIVVEGNSTSVNLSTTDATMIYICTLLKSYQGTRLYLRELSIPNHQKEKRQWISAVYRVLYPWPEQDFDDWYEKLYTRQSNQPGHPIHQGKSSCNSKLLEYLQKDLSATYLCRLQSGKDEHGPYYEVYLPSDCIILPEELRKLVN